MKSELIKYRARIPLQVLALTAVILSSQYYLDTSVALAAEPAQTKPDEKKWSSWLEGAGIWSSERSRGEALLFVPLMQDADSIVFTDMRGKFFEEDEIEGNFALGMREMTPSGWNLGAWAGLDARKTEASNHFYQASGGLEALHPNYDIRVNGYVSLSDAKRSPSLAKTILSGSSIMMIGGREVPLSGVDGEIGVRLPLENLSPALAPEKVELRVYGGGFYFDDFDNEALDEVAGVKARIALAINDVFEALPGTKLTLEYEYSHDDVRDDINEVGLRLRIPLGGADSSHPPVALASMSAQERRMMAGLERDTDIVSVRSKAEKVVDILTNVQFNRVAYASGGGTLAGAIAQGGNTLIIATGAPNGNETLQGNQTLQGGGSTIAVRGARSGTVANFTAPGARPVIDHNTNAALLIGGSNAHVAGVSFTGGGNAGQIVNNHGIQLDSNRSNVFIQNVSISGFGRAGIDLTNNNEVTVIDTTIANTWNSSIRAQGSNIITVRGTTLTNTTGASASGIFANKFNTLIVSGTTISNIANDGIHLNDDNKLTVSGTTISGTGDDGIFMDERNIVTVSDTTFAGAIGGDLIKLFGPVGNGNTLSGSGNVNNAMVTGAFCNEVAAGSSSGQIAFVGGATCP